MFGKGMDFPRARVQASPRIKPVNPGENTNLPEAREQIPTERRCDILIRGFVQEEFPYRKEFRENARRMQKQMMSTRPSILIVDDEIAITDMLAAFLGRSGYTVEVAANGEDAMRKIETDEPDLTVLDVLMPRMDGREVLRQLRRSGNWMPVILLTQVGEASERAMALEEGADDYINKPFSPHELAARIRAVLRRARPGRPPLSVAGRLTCGPLKLDRVSRRVWLESNELALTPKSVMLLEYMMTHPDELVSRERLLDVVWGWDFPVGTRAVDTRVGELRRALNDDPASPRYIETIPGKGYRFVGEVDTF
jgi:DNA-binding response OmpR family regulator